MSLEPTLFANAPWTDEEVENLNKWQRAGYLHEFTCPNDHGKESRVLVAKRDGWHCPSCAYTQSWAHPHMLKGPPPNPFDRSTP